MTGEGEFVFLRKRIELMGHAGTGLAAPLASALPQSQK